MNKYEYDEIDIADFFESSSHSIRPNKCLGIAMASDTTNAMAVTTVNAKATRTGAPAKNFKISMIFSFSAVAEYVNERVPWFCGDVISILG